MTKVIHASYSVGKYLGTSDATVNHGVWVNESPVTPERPDAEWARIVAERAFAREKAPKQLIRRNCDSGEETILATVPK